jgi:hypothetical protein
MNRKNSSTASEWRSLRHDTGASPRTTSGAMNGELDPRYRSL